MPTGHGPSFADAVERVRPAIVQISVLEEPHTVLGSGFLVSTTGHVVTARHVVEAARGTLSVNIPYPNTQRSRENFAVFQAEVQASDREHDVALLRTTENPFAGMAPALLTASGGKGLRLSVDVARFERRRPRDGDNVVISGFPLGEAVLITSAGIVASAWRLGPELCLPGQPSRPVSDDAYLVDAVANAGNSGGPVYQTDGRIIGVCIANLKAYVGALSDEPVRIGKEALTYSSGLTLVSPAVYVCELLERHGIEVIEDGWDAAGSGAH